MPSHESFSAIARTTPWTWLGSGAACTPSSACHAGKLAACRRFNRFFLELVASEPSLGLYGDTDSCVDDAEPAHGTHCAATAVGNPAPARVDVGGPDGNLTQSFGTMSGMAPGAALAVYR